MAASSSRAKIGLGAKILFTQSGAMGEITNLNDIISWTRTSFDATHLGVPTLDQVKTNGQMIPGGIAKLDPSTMTVHFDSAAGMPHPGDEETIEITFPRRKAESIPAKFSATGWVSKVGGLSVQPDTKMTANITIDWTGDYTFTKPVLA